MGLFDQVMSAVNNPNTQGSMDQIGGILNTVQQLSGNAGTDSSTMQSAMGVVGNFYMFILLFAPYKSSLTFEILIGCLY